MEVSETTALRRERRVAQRSGLRRRRFKELERDLDFSFLVARDGVLGFCEEAGADESIVPLTSGIRGCLRGRPLGRGCRGLIDGDLAVC